MAASPARDPTAQPEDLGTFFLERANAGDVEGLVTPHEPAAVLAFYDPASGLRRGGVPSAHLSCGSMTSATTQAMLSGPPASLARSIR